MVRCVGNSSMSLLTLLCRPVHHITHYVIYTCIFVYSSGARFSKSRNVKKWSRTYETESKYCPRIRSLLVSKIFTNFVGITQTVFSLPSADFVAAVKKRKICQMANYSCRRTNKNHLITSLFTFCILLHSSIHTTMADSSHMSLSNFDQTFMIKTHLQLF